MNLPILFFIFINTESFRGRYGTESFDITRLDDRCVPSSFDLFSTLYVHSAAITQFAAIIHLALDEYYRAWGERKRDRKNKQAFVQHILPRGERCPCTWEMRKGRKTVTGCLFMYSLPTRRVQFHAARRCRKSQSNESGDGYQRETGWHEKLACLQCNPSTFPPHPPLFFFMYRAPRCVTVTLLHRTCSPNNKNCYWTEWNTSNYPCRIIDFFYVPCVPFSFSETSHAVSVFKCVWLIFMWLHSCWTQI